MIKAGSLIPVLILRQTNNYNSDDFQFVWNIYANNDVVVPTGGCDVSARDVTVTLPDYPGSVPIPLTVYCAKSQNLGYYLSGTTADAGNSIFTNTASFSPAQGVGVQLTRNGTIIPANNTVSLGAVRTSAVSLGLTANYARTGGQCDCRECAIDYCRDFCLSIKKSQGIANAGTQYYLKLKPAR